MLSLPTHAHRDSRWPVQRDWDLAPSFPCGMLFCLPPVLTGRSCRVHDAVLRI